MPHNIFIQVPEHGHVLISGPLFNWLTQQNATEVSLPWSPSHDSASSLTTHPLQYLRWKMVLFFDDNKRAKQAWRLEPYGELPDEDAMQYIEEIFSK